MAKTIAYMLTWTTYGTWLQGDKRRYVEEGKILPANEALVNVCEKLLTKEPVKFDKEQRRIVEDAIQQKAIQFGQKIYALAVRSNHVHLLVGYIPKPIELVVQHYKSCAFMALTKIGITGQIWTKGFNKRYCFDETTLHKKIEYIKKHFHSDN